MRRYAVTWQGFINAESTDDAENLIENAISADPACNAGDFELDTCDADDASTDLDDESNEHAFDPDDSHIIGDSDIDPNELDDLD